MKNTLKGIAILTGILFGNPDAWAACPASIPVNTICVTWQAPTQNVDGTPLTDLAGFELYWNLATFSAPIPSNRIDIPDPLQDTLNQATDTITFTPPAGGGDVEFFFRMTAYDTSGNVSALSNEVAKIVTFGDTLPPAFPTILDVLINIETGS